MCCADDVGEDWCSTTGSCVEGSTRAEGDYDTNRPQVTNVGVNVGIINAAEQFTMNCTTTVKTNCLDFYSNGGTINCNQQDGWSGSSPAYTYSYSQCSYSSAPSYGTYNVRCFLDPDASNCDNAGSCTGCNSDGSSCSQGSGNDYYQVQIEVCNDGDSTYGDGSPTCCSYNSGYWAIGGEIDGSACCTDDGDESRRTRSCDNSYACTSDGNDDACCLTGNDCVHSSTCYDSSTHNHDVDSNGDNEYCLSGVWYDCLSTADCSSNPTWMTVDGEICSSGECQPESCTSNDCYYCRKDGYSDCDNNGDGSGRDRYCCSDTCFFDSTSENPGIVATGACDTSNQPICDASSGSDMCVPSGSCGYDASCDTNAITAYVSSGDTSIDFDCDGDNDYCSSGTWYDCNTDSQCQSGYYCSSGDCVVCTSSECSTHPNCRDGTAGCCDSDSDCGALQYCDDGDDSTPVYKCENAFQMARGTINTTNMDTTQYTDVGFYTNLASTSGACVMYDVYDAEDNTQFDLYVQSTKVADAEGGGNNLWLLYKYYNVTSQSIVGNTLWKLDAIKCCHTYDNLLFGWLVSEAGQTDGSSSTSCCDASTDCVDDYVQNSDWGCYNTGSCHDTGSSASSNEYCDAGTWRDDDYSQTACEACVGVGNWSIGGEVAGSACCQDDSGENRRVETQGNDAPSQFSQGTDACCNANTKCVEADTCYADASTFGTIPSKGYCSSGIWVGGDNSSTACTAIVGSGYWNLGGEVAASSCCGDDGSGENRITEQSGTDAPSGYNDGITTCCNSGTDCTYNDVCSTAGDASSPSIPNKAWCCKTSEESCTANRWYGGDAYQSACIDIAGAGKWNIGGDIATCCGDDSTGEYVKNEIQGNDAPSLFDDNTDACCNVNTKCVENNACYADASTFGTIPSKGYCSSGIWVGGDNSSTACTAIVGSGYWALGGEVDGSACCEDDNSQYKRTCTDSSANGDCGGDTVACCNANTKCVDSSGACQTTAACHSFGTSLSYCNAGTWEDPDEASSYCTASGCSFSWDNVINTCCADDTGEDWCSTTGSCVQGSSRPEGNYDTNRPQITNVVAGMSVVNVGQQFAINCSTTVRTNCLGLYSNGGAISCNQDLGWSGTSPSYVYSYSQCSFVSGPSYGIYNIRCFLDPDASNCDNGGASSCTGCNSDGSSCTQGSGNDYYQTSIEFCAIDNDGSANTYGDNSQSCCTHNGGTWQTSGVLEWDNNRPLSVTPACCGDDSNENSWHFKCLGDACTQGDNYENAMDVSCCDNPGDCVYNGYCYSKDAAVDVDGDGLKEYCDPGNWTKIPNGMPCDEGGECQSNFCIEGTCRQGCNNTYDGQMCSDDGFHDWDNDGICAKNSVGTWDCDETEASLYSSDYYTDCDQSTGNGEECDSNSLAGGYTRDGRCYSADCCTSIYAANGCDCISNDNTQCDSTPSVGSTYDGICTNQTTDVCCTNGNVVSKSSSNYYCGCSNGNGRACDSSLTSATYAQDGVCTFGSTCDIDDVCVHSGTYYGTMSSCSEGDACDGDVNPGYSADGIVFNNDGSNLCCNAGEDYEDNAGTNCCYNNALLADGTSSGSILCYNGQLYDCGSLVTTSPDADTNDADCQQRGSHYCDAGLNQWFVLMPTGCGVCTTGDMCEGGMCIEGTCRATCGSAYSLDGCSEGNYDWDSGKRVCWDPDGDSTYTCSPAINISNSDYPKLYQNGVEATEVLDVNKTINYQNRMMARDYSLSNVNTTLFVNGTLVAWNLYGYANTSETSQSESFSLTSIGTKSFMTILKSPYYFINESGMNSTGKPIVVVVDDLVVDWINVTKSGNDLIIYFNSTYLTGQSRTVKTDCFLNCDPQDSENSGSCSTGASSHCSQAIGSGISSCTLSSPTILDDNVVYCVANDDSYSQLDTGTVVTSRAFGNLTLDITASGKQETDNFDPIIIQVRDGHDVSDITNVHVKVWSGAFEVFDDNLAVGTDCNSIDSHTLNCSVDLTGTPCEVYNINASANNKANFFVSAQDTFIIDDISISVGTPNNTLIGTEQDISVLAQHCFTSDYSGMNVYTYMNNQLIATNTTGPTGEISLKYPVPLTEGIYNMTVFVSKDQFTDYKTQWIYVWESDFSLAQTFKILEAGSGDETDFRFYLNNPTSQSVTYGLRVIFSELPAKFQYSQSNRMNITLAPFETYSGFIDVISSTVGVYSFWVEMTDYSSTYDNCTSTSPPAKSCPKSFTADVRAVFNLGLFSYSIAPEMDYLAVVVLIVLAAIYMFRFYL
jgi:hypothetical protein